MRPELPEAVVQAPPRDWQVWWAAIRPRTLSIAAAPVLLGTALAVAEGHRLQWLPMFAALACAILIQVATNLHNDAADFERGTDDATRVGPLRVTAAGWVRATTVRRAALASFGCALLLGVYLVARGGPVILGIGIASLLAGWSYSGGPRPISHTALGEVFVLAFFGIAAVAGSHWLQAAHASPAALLGGMIVGLPAAAVLLVNNYRDLESDLRAGRRTLAARLGRPAARRLHAALLLVPFALLPLYLPTMPGALLGLAALPSCLRLIQRLRRTAPGPELNLLLAATARTGFLLGILLTTGILLGGLIHIGAG